MTLTESQLDLIDAAADEMQVDRLAFRQVEAEIVELHRRRLNRLARDGGLSRPEEHALGHSIGTRDDCLVLYAISTVRARGQDARNEGARNMWPFPPRTHQSGSQRQRQVHDDA